MKEILIENSRIPKLLSVFINIKAITLWPFIIFRNETDDVMLNHERIHLVQQRELWLVGFYILYVYYWLKNMVIFRLNPFEAYTTIPFEYEARFNEKNAVYTATRKPFGWRDYRFK